MTQPISKDPIAPPINPPGWSRWRPAVRCSARSSRTGQPCRNFAIRGGSVCTTHGGRAPKVKAAARRNAEDVLTRAYIERRLQLDLDRAAGR